MQIGVDSFALHPLNLDPFGQLAWAHERGFDGIQFGGIDDLSGGDAGRLAELRAQADSLGLYTHVSVDGCNPFFGNLPEEELVAALSRRVALAARFGWRELHGVLGGPKERYELPTAWTEQLEASARVLTALRPVLRDNGSRINLETHGDVTTFELIRFIERVGADVVGICLDTANVLLHGEHPVAAARRAAPYTRLTHCKDALVFLTEGGLRRQTVALGSGLIDWAALVGELSAHQPDLKLTIEDHKWLFDAEIFDPRWQRLNPDTPRDELLEVVRVAAQNRRRVAEGELPAPEVSEEVPYGVEMEGRLTAGLAHLRGVVTVRS